LNNGVIASLWNLIALIKNNPQKDRSIKILKVLQIYINGKKVIRNEG